MVSCNNVENEIRRKEGSGCELTPNRKSDFVDVISRMPDSEILGAIRAGLAKTRGEKNHEFFAHLQVIS